MSLKRRGSAQSWLLVFHAWKGSFPGSVGDHAPALARLGVGTKRARRLLLTHNLSCGHARFMT
jgi:hypothetical protein